MAKAFIMGLIRAAYSGGRNIFFSLSLHALLARAFRRAFVAYAVPRPRAPVPGADVFQRALAPGGTMKAGETLNAGEARHSMKTRNPLNSLHPLESSPDI
jgi:hypothetical protein